MREVKEQEILKKCKVISGLKGLSKEDKNVILRFYEKQLFEIQNKFY